MKSLNKSSYTLISLLIISIFIFSDYIKADNPSIELLGPVINHEPFPFNITCGSILVFTTGDVFEIYINVTNTDYTCPVTLDYFTGTAPPIIFDPPLPLSASPGATVKTHLIYPVNIPAVFTIQLRARDCHDTSYCELSFDWKLPMELTSFISVIKKNDITLKWTTSSENNNERFEIERSITDSKEWKMVGAVPGFGNSSIPVSYSFTDRALNTGNYNYRLKQIDFNGDFKYHYLSNDVSIETPVKYNLSQNYPNPFNPVTRIDFEIPQDGNVNISVYDNSGKLVTTITNGFKTAGYYTSYFNASDLSSGVYFYRLESQNFNQVKKMTLIK